MNTTHIIGVDEVGRGCLYGPVVAAAVSLPPTIDNQTLSASSLWSQVKDSKKFSSEKKRSTVAAFLRENAVAFGIGEASVEEIDDVNIFHATMKAMHRAIDECIAKLLTEHSGRPLHVHLKVDGDHFKHYTPAVEGVEVTHECCLGGDDSEQPIAAASIIAKVYRDAKMKDAAANDPRLANLYKIGKNKGYGTREHMEALRTHGYIPGGHRQSFSPVANATPAATTIIHPNTETYSSR
jgi:ribonuclease HII